mmetsp:Transcript_47579/g.146846  ORF Transcript_47579/g.146846 Transcript_47579/m.146846 type:complete len:248 (+) Transcript_47579:265-1008(+)
MLLGLPSMRRSSSKSVFCWSAVTENFTSIICTACWATSRMISCSLSRRLSISLRTSFPDFLNSAGLMMRASLYSFLFAALTPPSASSSASLASACAWSSTARACLRVFAPASVSGESTFMNGFLLSPVASRIATAAALTLCGCPLASSSTSVARPANSRSSGGSSGSIGLITRSSSALSASASLCFFSLTANAIQMSSCSTKWLIPSVRASCVATMPSIILVKCFSSSCFCSAACTRPTMISSCAIS